MPTYRVEERCIYEVEADSRDAAVRLVKNGLGPPTDKRVRFAGVLGRSVECVGAR